MTADESFLAAIYAAPEDDVARLVYADWLEERGQGERAEFIRLQCRLARDEALTPVEDDRTYDLTERHRPAWTSHLPHDEGATWQFRHGFPEELEIAVAALLEHYERWVAVPRVRYLTLRDTTAYYLRAFAQRVWPPGWIGLQFVEEPKPWLHEWTHDPASGIAAVVRSPQAAQLRELRFHGWGLGDGGVRALCKSPYLGELAVLEVDQAHFSDARLVERFGAKLRQGCW